MTNPRPWLLGLLVAGLTALSGCTLYLGDGDDEYTYCDSQGCYYCDDYGCSPSPGGGPDDGDGGRCETTADCPEGCYCSDRGTCEWYSDDPVTCSANGDCPDGSFCDPATGTCSPTWTCWAAGDCGPGFDCDDRGTCVPAPCESDDECLEGCVCNAGTCEETGTCTRDSDCESGSTCDTDRSTCTPCGPDGCTPPDPGTCYAAPTCDLAPPACPDGSLPGVIEGCYSGFCIPEALCPDEPPFACSDVEDEATCVAAPTCRPVYVGIDCTDPAGDACQPGVPRCVCEEFRYGFCEDLAAP